MTNRVTAVMLAAANMKPADIYNDINERAQWPYKADTPEHGLDISLIYETAKQTRGLQYARDGIILVASLIGIFNLQKSPSPEDFYAGPGFNWLAIFLTLLVVAATHFVFQRAMRDRARKVLREVSKEDDGGSASTGDAEAGHNLIISGGFSPFVGAGFGRRSWSFTVDLQKPAKEAEPIQPLNARDLYSETESDIHGLHLPRLSISDLVCVDGRDVGELDLFPSSGRDRKPAGALPPAEIEKLLGENHTRLRHYKVLRAQLWGGQLVFSTFFRYVIQSNLLFVEARVFELPPLKKEFLEYEHMPATADFKEIRGDILLSLVMSPILWIPVALRVATFLAGGWIALFRNPEQANADAIDRDRKFNYGWAQSLREHWCSRDYERYFQSVDVDFYEKSIKEALLESLLDSLTKRNISIESFKAASTTIFNDGIMMSGGTLNAESLAMGSGASALVNKTLGGIRGGGTQPSPGKA